MVKKIKICANPMEITNKCLTPGCYYSEKITTSYQADKRPRFCPTCGKKLDFRMN